MNRISQFALVSVLTVLPAAAQIQVSLDSLAAKAADTAGVSLDSNMLKLAANFLSGGKAEDPEFQKVMNGLKSIVVKSYKFREAGQYQDSELAPLRQQLASSGWTVMISHSGQDGHSEIYTKIDSNQVAGITIVAAKPKEVAVVSVEGSIDLAKLAQLAGHFGIPTGLPTGDAGKTGQK